MGEREDDLTFSASWSESGLSAPFRFGELNQENLIRQWGPFAEFFTQPLHAQGRPLPTLLGPLNSSLQPPSGEEPGSSSGTRSRGAHRHAPLPSCAGTSRSGRAPRCGAGLAPGSKPSSWASCCRVPESRLCVAQVRRQQPGPSWSDPRAWADTAQSWGPCSWVRPVKEARPTRSPPHLP